MGKQTPQAKEVYYWAKFSPETRRNQAKNVRVTRAPRFEVWKKIYFEEFFRCNEIIHKTGEN